MQSADELRTWVWHQMQTADVLEALNAPASGVTEADAAERLARFGPNVIPHKPPPAWWVIAARQFKSPLIYILGVAGALSALTGHLEDSAFILGVLLLNAGIGSYQELKAQRSTQALQQMLRIRATVVRDGETVEVDAEELVPGDSVVLESGNRVPADLRLMQSHGLEVDESLLTGESLPVTKESDSIMEEGATLGDRINMAYAGSTVTRGRGVGVVVATGAGTVVGGLALDVMSAAAGRPPLLERMEKFTHVVAWSVLTATAVIALSGVLLRGYSFEDMFLFGVALAVSAIPEGLPVALTVALAVATTRMAKRGVIVRRLAAVEGLGSCTLIASDKTGTLTCNELMVRTLTLPDGAEYRVAGEGYTPIGELTMVGDGSAGDGSEGGRTGAGAGIALQRLAEAAVLCNEGDLHQRGESWVWHGDPTDVALLAFGHKAGMVRERLLMSQRQIAAIPFEPEHRYAATFHTDGDAVFVKVKGAPERVLAMCALSDAERARHMHLAEEMAARGDRVLAFADADVSGTFDRSQAPPEPGDLRFLGFTGMIDPLRPGAADAVRACQRAGVSVCMITGDHPVTALAIARELQLASDPEQVISGSQLEGMSDEELRQTVKTRRVFARTTPRQKLEIVQAAQAIGHYVAVTGDGVNDAPALRQANIGVAMGKSGTDVAREAAELVITDDNFSTIVAGVEEGRVAYDNVRKVVYLLISTGLAEVLLLGIAVLSGWPDTAGGAAVLPLLPVQILWLNVVTNGIQDVALAFEPSEGRVLERAPRSVKEGMFNRLMIERSVLAALVMAGVGFASFAYMIEVLGWSESASRNALLLQMVLFQNLHVGNCRSETRSVVSLSPLRSPVLLAGVLAAFSLHILALHLPLAQRILGVQPVDLQTFGVLLVTAFSIIVVMELHKLWWRGRGTATPSRTD